MRKSDFVFFLTGVVALVYETVWARSLTRILGSDAGAAAIVLATFMAGLGLGGACASRLARKTARPVELFAALELFVAAWAAASPFLMGLLHPIDGFTARAAVSAAMLLPPTLAMGATFPLMGRIAIPSAAATHGETAAFYGANTLGAALGALLAACVFMPLLGLSGALYAAALLDVVAAGLALAWLPRENSTPEVERPPPPWSMLHEPVLFVAFALGAASLAIEVLSLRLLVTVTGASVYAFALVLAVFLCGIGLGGRQLAQQRGSATRGPRDLDILFYCALCAPLLMLVGLWTLRAQLGENDLFGSLANRVPTGAGLARLWATHALLAALALLAPAFAFGMALPAAAAALVERYPTVPRETLLGRLYGFNTFGALCGSLGAAFVLLPALGPRRSFAIVLLVPALAALLVPGRRLVPWVFGVLAGFGASYWVLAPGEPARDRQLLLVRHDAHTSAAVEETRAFDGSLVRTLRVNGKPEASSAPVDVRLQLLLGHIPGVLHGDVKTALVIGLGSGMTAGSLLDLPSMNSLSIFEISPAIEDAARAFSDWNGAVLDDPRTRLVFADGRHALASSNARFDLITADPVHPWTRGSSDLYTLEHFRSIAAHLAPGGVASQWLPVYELSSADLETVAATWCAAFEHTSAWLSAYDLILVGAQSPPRGGEHLVDVELSGRLRESLARVAIHSGVDLQALQVAGDAELRAFASGQQPMRDDDPVLEFRAPLSYLSGYNTQVLRWAARSEYVSELPEKCRPRAVQFRAALGRFLDQLPSGAGRAAASYGQELLALRR